MKYNKKWGRTVEKDVAIKVTHVSKDFKLYYDKANTLKRKKYYSFLRKIEVKIMYYMF